MDYKKMYDDLVESNKENAVIQSMNDMMKITNKMKEENGDLKSKNTFLMAMLRHNKKTINNIEYMLYCMVDDEENGEYDEENVEYYKNLISFVKRMINRCNFDEE